MRFSYTFIFPVLLFSILIQSQDLSNTSPPNIIIYLADDQNAWDYGIHGNDQVDTSNYDRLVREGIFFSNAYTAQAICAPARSQLFTGLFPIRNGCMANHLPVKKLKDINDYFNDLGWFLVFNSCNGCFWINTEKFKVLYSNLEKEIVTFNLFLFIRLDYFLYC